jgi:hypothetical protein
MESVPDLLAKLTPEQRQQFNKATSAFTDKHYSDALTIFKSLMTELPRDAVLAKYASETALNAGEMDFALTTVKPIANADANDWQAAAILTRACAETGDEACRDRGMQQMVELHRNGITPNGMRDYVVEQVKLDTKTLVIRSSLEPWGNYKVYDLGKMFGPDGTLIMSITIESNDFDQPLFAKEHPQEAAAGLRQFSLDAYAETGLNSNGKRTQTHYTYKFFVGQPKYDTVRQEFINVASGKSQAMSSRSNLTAP